MAIDVEPHRFSTAEYEELIDSGALQELRVELLDGVITDMSPQGYPHEWIIHSLMRRLAARDDLMLRVQMTLPVVDGWVPEPDIALAVKPPRPARPTTIHFVAEVAMSSQRRDRQKADSYAGAGIPRYWIVDIPGERVLEHTDPTPEGYALIRPLSGDDVLDTGVEGIATFTVAELLSDVS